MRREVGVSIDRVESGQKTRPHRGQVKRRLWQDEGVDQRLLEISGEALTTWATLDFSSAGGR